MKFNLSINMDNDAYQNQAVQHELIDNLKAVIAKLEDSCDFGTVKDINGNTVGVWVIEGDE